MVLPAAAAVIAAGRFVYDPTVGLIPEGHDAAVAEPLGETSSLTVTGAVAPAAGPSRTPPTTPKLRSGTVLNRTANLRRDARISPPFHWKPDRCSPRSWLFTVRLSEERVPE